MSDKETKRPDCKCGHEASYHINFVGEGKPIPPGPPDIPRKTNFCRHPIFFGFCRCQDYRANGPTLTPSDWVDLAKDEMGKREETAAPAPPDLLWNRRENNGKREVCRLTHDHLSKECQWEVLDGLRVPAWFTYDATSPIGGHIEIAPLPPPSETKLTKALDDYAHALWKETEPWPIDWLQRVATEHVKSARSSLESLYRDLEQSAKIQAENFWAEKWMAEVVAHEQVRAELSALRSLQLTEKEAKALVVLARHEARMQRDTPEWDTWLNLADKLTRISSKATSEEL